LSEKEARKEKDIERVNAFINFRLLNVNKKLNVYFDVKEPFYGYYDPDEGSNSGIIINVRTESSGIYDILSNQTSQVQNNKIIGEHKIFEEMLKKRYEFFEQCDTEVYWKTYYDPLTNSFKTRERVYFTNCFINGKGISKKINLIQKINPNSKKLNIFLKREKLRKIYNVVETDTEMFEFIDNEIEQIVKGFRETNKIEIDEKINQLITKTIEEIKQAMNI
jgi:hypothetical protein